MKGVAKNSSFFRKLLPLIGKKRLKKKDIRCFRVLVNY